MTLAPHPTPSTFTVTALTAPHPDSFPLHPPAWFLFCRTSELAAGPVSKNLFGKPLVAWRTADNRISILDARCSHMGADLSRGTIQNNCLQCPFHHWQYGSDGRCTSIPALEPGADIPRFARQRAWPAAVMGPLLFVFNGPEPLYPLPFFAEKSPARFTPARPFSATLNCPWYITGSNAFDRQHFAAAHDRQMTADPVIDSPHPFARRASATFQIVGNSCQDRATRLLSGPTVTLTCTDYSGSLLFVTARFRRSTSFGMVSTRALEAKKTLVTVFVWTPNSPTRAARLTLDPLERMLRRYFIRKFLEADAGNLEGCDYQPQRLIAADRELAAYFTWLAGAAAGRSNSVNSI